MAVTKTIDCLANPRKLSGRCLAGKEPSGSSVGQWIRPVSARATEEGLGTREGNVLCVRTRTLAQVGSIRRPSVLGSFHATAGGIREPCSSRAFTPLRVLLQRRVFLRPIVLRATSRAAG